MARRRHSRMFPGGPSFIELPRNKRDDIVFDMKHRILSGDFARFGFDSWDIFPDEPQGLSWCDFNFLSRDKFIFYNGMAKTASNERSDIIRELAFEEARKALTPEEYARATEMKWEKLPSGHSRLITEDRPQFAQFDGRTYFEQVRYLETVLEAPPIFEHVRLDRSYKFGLGLSVVLDVEFITPSVLLSFIERFRERGEVEWQSPVPATKLDAPVYMSNAINI